MTENDSPPSPPPTSPSPGTLAFEQCEEKLELKSDEQLAHEARKRNKRVRRRNKDKDTTTADEPPRDAIAEYLAHLSPVQQKYCDDLRGFGWKDTRIYSLLAALQSTREDILARLRVDETSEEEIKRLNELCDAEITDYSHMKHPLATRIDEDYEFQLYLLEEEKRQRWVMLGME